MTPTEASTESIHTPAPPVATEPSTGPSTDVASRDRVLIGLLALFLGVLGFRWLEDSRRYARPISDDYRQKVDINAAPRSVLLQLPGVGPAKADRIVAEREAVGKLASLRSVPGFGDKSVQRLESHVARYTPDAEPDVLTRRLPAPAAPVANSKKAVPEAGSLPINTAPAEQLQKLPGIGAVLAQRIVAERERKPFAAPEDLRRVSGIGPKKLDQIRPLIRFD